MKIFWVFVLLWLIVWRDRQNFEVPALILKPSARCIKHLVSFSFVHYAILEGNLY